MVNIEIRLVRPEDWSAVNDFHNRAYDVHRTLEEWTWEFRGPKGEDPLFALAMAGGKVLGTQAVIPIEMLDRGEVFLTGKSEDTLVDSSIRGQGILELMYEVALQECRRRGIRALWGFTPATKAFERVGFVAPWRTQQLFFPLTASAPRRVSGWSGRVLGRVAFDAAGLVGTGASKAAWRITHAVADGPSRGRIGKGLAFEVSSALPSDCDSLSHRFSRQWDLATIYRSHDYMCWRVSQNPHVQARVVVCRDGEQAVGWCLYAIDPDSNGYVVDVMVADPIADVAGGSRSRLILIGLMARALEGLRVAGARSARMWTNQDSEYERFVRRTAQCMGFFRLRRGESSVFMNVDLDESQFTRIVRGLHSRLSTEGLAG